MSEFSEMLESYVTTKKVNKYQMAKYLSIDRSSLHKIIQGQRNAPSKDLVKHMGKYLELSPYETSELLELYSISLVSPERYYRRKNVYLFLSSFHAQPLKIEMPGFQKSDFQIQDKEVVPFSGTRQSLEYLIYHLVTKENENGKGMIKFLGTPQLPGFSNMFPLIQGKTVLRHILSFSKYDSILEIRDDHNFQSLSQIISLYAQFANRGVRYETAYYYGTDFSHSAFPPFPYMIVTSQYALSLSGDYQNGLLYKDSETVNYLNQIFDALYEKTTPLLVPIQDLTSQLALNQKIMSCKSDSEILFQLVPCLVPFIQKIDIRKYLLDDMAQKEYFINAFTTYIQNLIHRHEQIHPLHFCSLNGIRRFLEKGVFDEFSTDFYRPLDKADRKKVVQQFLKYAYIYDLRLLREDLGELSNGLKVYLSDSLGYIQFMSSDGNVIVLTLENPNFLSSFKDYFESMDADLYYPKEEALILIQKLLNQY
ncbi:hypothetical protein [Faecalicoccus pleomorphus]|uniref:HTH cro/C1-type domain-containing protein n=2 Tax=Faecalicoccus TaxID=1573536 RepID=A0AAW6CY17_9FIRM|nr:hypothetical protein [Faecalicoccus pleomorphus]MDB7980095.1 hypothetical protein [Faecalicoccus pleomorphus]MDB7982499.1 hypothetical protein [Faecalicoccus pleomorphus]